ncbi:MAG TPA: PAS domain S-box protein, partial [Bryobacteraceae bacterium]|nr:PAS domain S-box protein [Bryobacteraceae bacterium]
MAIIDNRGLIVYANRAVCQMSGYAEHELCGMHFTATLHPDDREMRREIFDKILAREIGSFINERRLLRKDGTVAWARTSVTIPGEWSGPPQIIIFIEDITERKKTEEALRASEERFRIAAENGSDAIYEWDLHSGQVFLYGHDHRRLGDWPSPSRFEDWKKMVHPADLERILPDFERHIRTGERYSGEFRIIGQTGAIFHYSNRGQAIRNAAGEPSKWIGLATDITESKLAEEAVSQLAAIVQSSENAIFATNLDGAITTWNHGAQALLGYTPAEALGLPVRALFGSSDCAREISLQIRHGQPVRVDDAAFLRNDGTHVPVLISISPIRKPNGGLSGAAVIARDISERKQVEREMAHRALHDHLTGLPNRLLLSERLSQSIASAERASSGAAVIFIDLDSFKFVNDTLGHEAGDALLQQVAQRLGACIRREDLLARMGGDEFMLVANHVGDEQTASIIAERLRAALRAPFYVAFHELIVTASIGVSVYPRDGTDESTLRRNADTAMYEAKQSGKDRVRFYRPALGAAVQARLELETDLRHAIERGELALFYQPVYAVADDRQTAFEALARWPHPRL